MLSALDCVDPRERLRVLLRRWRVEELVLEATATELQGARDFVTRELAWRRVHGAEPEPAEWRRVEWLQEECDAIAVELSHVRFALAGAGEELERHDADRLAC